MQTSLTRLFLILVLLTAVGLSVLAEPSAAQRGYWHYMIQPVAAVRGEVVRFGDIAVPLTDHGRAQWANLADRPM